MARDTRWVDLNEDLRLVGVNHTLAKAYLQANGEDEATYSTLAAVIRSIVGDPEWEARPNRALIETIRTAIDRLPTTLVQRKPGDKELERVPTPAVGAPERRLAEIVYGYADNFVREELGIAKDQVDYSARHQCACSVADLTNYSKSTRERFTRVIRQDLAGTLLQMEQEACDRQAQPVALAQAAADEAGTFPPSPLLPGYITRASYETRLLEALHADKRLFLLHGDAGTGKSTLARHAGDGWASIVANKMGHEGAPLPAQPPHGEFIEVNARTSLALVESISLILDDRGKDANLPPVLVRKRFKQFLASPEAPTSLLMDNVEPETWELVRDLIPETPQTAIFLTARTRLQLPEAAFLLSIGEMEPTEAAALVHAQLPNVSDEDASGLAYDLGHRPLAIRQACAFLAHDRTTIPEFRDLLRQDISKTLKAVTRGETALTTIYRLVIKQFEDDPASFDDALRLLDLILAVGGHDASQEFLRALWNGTWLFSTEQRATSLQDMTFQSALRILEDRCLVGPGVYVQDNTPVVRMHALTTELLVALREQAWNDLHRDLLEPLVEHAPLPGYWEPGRSMPLRLSRQVLDWRHLFRGLMRAQYSFPHLVRLATVLVRGITQDYPSDDDTILPLVLHVLGHGNRLLRVARFRPGDTDTEVPQLDEAVYARSKRDAAALEQELLYLIALFPHSGIGVRASAATQYIVWRVPYLATGCERHPDARELLWDRAEPQAGTGTFAQRLLANAERDYRDGHRFEAGNRHFALGTVHFDDHRLDEAHVSFQRARAIWNEDPRAHLGELCKTGARIARTYYRQGNYLEAEGWRLRTIGEVRRQLDTYGTAEWTADHSGNYFLFELLCGYPPAYPELPAVRPARDLDELYGPLGDHGPALIAVAQELGETETIYLPWYLHAEAISIAPSDPLQALELLDEAQELRVVKSWPLAQFRLFLSRVKIGMYADETEGTMHCTTELGDQLNTRIWDTYKNLNSRYWYADALLTGYVLCGRYHCATQDYVDSLGRGMRGAYELLQRPDRIQMAEAAVPAAENSATVPFNPLWLLSE